MYKKTILITGCCGFIGSHLTDFFIKKNFQVFGLDNLLTGDINNINHLSNNKNFKFIEHDVCKTIKIYRPPPWLPGDFLKKSVNT